MRHNSTDVTNNKERHHVKMYIMMSTDTRGFSWRVAVVVNNDQICLPFGREWFFLQMLSFMGIAHTSPLDCLHIWDRWRTLILACVLYITSLAPKMTFKQRMPNLTNTLISVLHNSKFINRYDIKQYMTSKVRNLRYESTSWCQKVRHDEKKVKSMS